VRTTIIQEQDGHTVGNGRGKGIHEQLKGLGIQLRQFAEEALPCGRGHRPIDLEPCEDVLDRSHGLDPVRCEAAAAHGQQPQTAFVLAEHAHRAGVLRRDDALEPLLTGRLEVLNSLRVFLCDWGAAP
jgi:hypothetical protein